MKKKDFTFIKNRQPRKNAKIEANFSTWVHPLAGYEPPQEVKRTAAAVERLRNRGIL